MFETSYKMIAMLQSGLDARKVITHRMKAADYATGFELMKQGSYGKVVLDYTFSLAQRGQSAKGQAKTASFERPML
jgi:hypothetical protein